MTKTAEIFSVRTSNHHGFRWAWRCSDDNRHSSSDFLYFYECVEDARAAGYQIKLAHTQRKTVDGRLYGLT